jgi:hypothetical protein
MGQFEVVEAIFESDSPLSKRELQRQIDLHSSSVDASIQRCLEKGHIIEKDSGFVCSENFDKKDLESIRPKTIEELKDG